jgi:DNA (cytosine-5)-methyltransferase 1
MVMRPRASVSSLWQSRGRKPITWPEATHSAKGGTDMFGKTMKKWRAAREIIDWERKGESIYSRKRPLKATTLARIYAGIDKFCGPLIAEAFLRDVSSQFPTTLVKEFLVILRRHGDARSIDEPLPTLCAGGQHVGARAVRVCSSRVAACRAMWRTHCQR